MDPQSSESQDTQFSQNTELKSKRKLPPVLMGISILATVVAILGYVFFRESKITGLEVAFKTSSFLDKTFRSDGSWVSGYSCDKSLLDQCILSTAEQTHTGQGILAYYFLAQAASNQAFKEKADSAINYVIERCNLDGRVCEWNYFPLAQYYQDTKDQKYLTRGLLIPAEAFLTRTDEGTVLGNLGMKLATLYGVTGDIRFRDRLLEVADLELKRRLGDQPHYDTQVVWSVYLPAYRITGDRKYLVAAEEFFDGLDLPNNLILLKNDATSVIKAIEVLLDLDGLSLKKGIYKSQAKTVLQELLLQLWDTPKNTKFNGDYGFINNMTGNEKSDKPMLFNGWIMQLYLKLGNETFKDPRAKLI